MFHPVAFTSLGGLPLGRLIVSEALDCAPLALMLLFLMFWCSFDESESVDVSVSMSSAIATKNSY